MLKNIDWEKVDKYVNDGYINVQQHPTLPLWLYNYTNSTQYNFFWNNETMQCRGLIVDADKNIVSACLSKFFTVSQLESLRSHLFASHILRKIAANEPFTVQDKLDGSMLSISAYEGQLIVATRGSFNSDQAIKAREILANKYPTFSLPNGITIICEVIYPQNRVVINYGEIEDIFIFAAIDNFTRQELDIYSMDLPFPKAERYEYADFEELCNLQPENKEGFVVKFADGSRVKIKTEDYKAKHKIFTNVNERTIWEYLSSGKPLSELLEMFDDIFYDFVRDTSKNLQEKFTAIYNKAVEDYNTILDLVPDDLSDRHGRKLFAELAKTCENHDLLFLLLDYKSLDELIWEKIEPKFPKKPFVGRLDEE